MQAFANMDDLNILFRPIEKSEEEKATKLLDVVSDSLRQEAKKVGKDLDQMVVNGEVLENVVKSVTVDVVGRALMTSTNDEPLASMSQSAMGYSFSGTYLVPGGGLFIKKSELARLGLKRQRLGVIDFDGEN